jgi:Glycosyl hydrolases family 16
MADPITDEQRKNIAASLRSINTSLTSIADVLDPPVTPTPAREPSPVPSPTPAPRPSIPPLSDRFELVKLTTFDGSNLPSDIYAYGHSKGNEGIGYRDPSKVSIKDGKLITTATGDTSGAVGQNVKQQYGFWEVHAMFEKGQGYKPCILLWPGQKDSAGKATWPGWLEYDMVETNSERNGGFCNVHYGQTNTQMGPNNFSGDLSQSHTYGCGRSPEGVTFYLDGNVIKKLTGTYARSTRTAWAYSSTLAAERGSAVTSACMSTRYGSRN